MPQELCGYAHRRRKEKLETENLRHRASHKHKDTDGVLPDPKMEKPPKGEGKNKDGKQPPGKPGAAAAS